MANQADRRSMLEIPSRARGSVRSSHTDVFSDEFALEPYEVTDGHYETPTDRDDGHDGTSLSVPSRRSSYRTQSFESRTWRSRGSQRSETSSSIAPTVDDHASRVSHGPRSVTSVSDLGSFTPALQRSTRTTPMSDFSRAQSPYRGAMGPSHPYGMYPQDIGLTRTPSIATTSTIRQPERSYSGPSGPTQPYGMYPQNTVPEDEQIPVAGFSGMDQDYQRRLGPDREDVDDLIGPDGYAEQLPPYTRFANGIPPKYTSGMGSVRRSGVPPNYISESGSIRRSAVPATPEDSQETLDSTRHHLNSSRDNASSTNPFGDSSTQLNSTAAISAIPKDEGGSFKERVREKSKSRVRVCCGVIPCWLLFVMSVVVILAVILGGGIGGMIAHKHIKEATRYNEPEAAHTVTASASSAAPTATVTATMMPSLPDAVPLASTPANLPALPTGTFAVSLTNSVSNTNSCLTNSAQSCAWDCATGANLSMVVTMAASNAPMISLSYETPSDGYVRYGSQPPQLKQPANLVLMKDKDDFNKGPAYVFQQQYDKVVIVHEGDIPGGIPNAKRSLLKRWFSDKGLENHGSLIRRQDDDEWTSDSIAKPVDRPWFCYWNNTILEGFIFVTQDGSASASNASPSAAASSSGSSQFPGSRFKRQSPTSPASYPKSVKIEERRPLNPSQPYCKQMQILNTYQPGPVINPSTHLVNTVYLSETESQSLVQNQAMQGITGGPPLSAPAASPSGFPKKRGAMDKRVTPPSSCQCGWMDD